MFNALQLLARMILVLALQLIKLLDNLKAIY